VPDSGIEPARFCSRCGQPVVVADAQFCKECGAPLASTRIFVRDPGFNPVTAALLSIVPGLGHVYKGRPGRGAAWFFAVLIAYGTGPQLGILIHVVCAVNAAVKGAVAGDDSRPRHRHRHRRSHDESEAYRTET
jgi:NADH pyrophosphatase zinc ribbon domain/Family of unknown function (DUF6677)